MNNDEAKFILSAYRPRGQDAADPAFTDALAQAGRDSGLQRWFEQSKAFDGKVAACLDAVAPPPGLREAILAGGRASFGDQRRGSRLPAWMALAAVLALTAGLSGWWLHLRHRGDSESALAWLALEDVAHHGPQHIGDPDAASRVALESGTGALDAQALPVDFARMERDGCRTLRLGGRRVIEVCFNRSGIEYHLYFMRRAPGDVPDARELPAQWEGAGAAAAAWSTPDYIVALATQGPAAALQRLL